MFEAYLRQRGIAVPEHEPDLGAKKRPDYLVEHAGERCICEVKEFAQGTMSMPVNGHRFLPKYGHRFSPPAAIFSPHWWP